MKTTATAPAPASGVCRTCGALMQHINGHWQTVAPNRTCQFGAAVHADVTPRSDMAAYISQGWSVAPAGTAAIR